MIAHLTPNTSWTLDPLQIVPTLVAAALYTRRVLALRDRGTPVPGWRIALFATGILTLLVAFVSPVHALGERMFSFHMLQHVLLGDLAPLALLGGLTGPILRPALRWLYRLRFLANPLVALPIWAVNLYAWHLPFLYDAALRHDAVHALEHVCFFTGGLIMWLPVVETLPAPEWFGTGAKLGYIAVVRVVETVLGNVFFWSGSVFYTVYVHQSRLWGISALEDQGIAGGVMMIEGSIVTLVALAWLFLRLASEGELRQQLIERGLDPRTVRRAVRYGRAEELSRSR
ncbi:MAG TPA: cytochrome c oxidase assembly protein [Gaiellaceae bacterium]|nr:cytochrome c oxidase assembly protein [Gaiellaceae bacterium]